MPTVQCSRLKEIQRLDCLREGVETNSAEQRRTYQAQAAYRGGTPGVADRQVSHSLPSRAVYVGVLGSDQTPQKRGTSEEEVRILLSLRVK